MSRSLVFVVAALASLTFLKATAAQDRDHAFVILRGRAVCLDAFDKPVDSPFACSDTNPRFGFASKDGKLYRFPQTDSMITVFTDSRVRERELQITARLHENNQLETIKVQSVKNGKLYDIYYFCDICNIRAYTPGLCPCCRNELEFRETAQ
jgi:hypothetical protein